MQDSPVVFKFIECNNNNNERKHRSFLIVNLMVLEIYIVQIKIKPIKNTRQNR